MKKIVPLSSLVVLVGPSGAGKSTLCQKHFDPGEVISSDALRQELMGDFRRQDHQEDVFDEFHRRIEWRISRGFRAVADATHIRDGDRLRTAEIGAKYGVPVVYMVVNRSVEAKTASAGWRATVRVKGKSLIEAHDQTFEANERRILSGDAGNHRVKIDLVVDTRTDDFMVVRKKTRDPKKALSELVDLGFNRIRVIGDVHGNMDGFLRASFVNSGTHLQFLGDIPDYGVDSLTVSEAVAKLVRDGKADNIRGNHELKVWRFVKGERARINNPEESDGYGGTISHGNEVTFNQIKAMADPQRLHWETMFLGLYENGPDHVLMDTASGVRYGFVHGGWHVSLFNETLFRLIHQSYPWKMAMFGETIENSKGPDGYPIRTYNWIEDLPARSKIVIGHDIQSRESPVVKTASTGATVLFLDTGSSKQGKLSWLDMEIVERKGGKFDLFENGIGSHG